MSSDNPNEDGVQQYVADVFLFCVQQSEEATCRRQGATRLRITDHRLKSHDRINGEASIRSEFLLQVTQGKGGRCCIIFAEPDYAESLVFGND